MTVKAPTRSRWRLLRLRLNSHTLTIDEYAEIEPQLTRPLTDNPIRRRNLKAPATPKEPGR